MGAEYDAVVGRVQANLEARMAGVGRQFAEDVTFDVLDALASVEWECRREAALCESEFEELCES